MKIDLISSPYSYAFWGTKLQSPLNQVEKPADTTHIKDNEYIKYPSGLMGNSFSEKGNNLNLLA
jgi:hypothetical protein